VKVAFVGASAQARSATANNQRTLNCYLEMDQGNPRAPVALYGTPGTVLRATLGAGGCRGSITSDGLTFWVAGNTVYTLTPGYVVTTLGTIGTSAGRVGIATNGTEVLIVDGAAGWLATVSALTQIVDVDFPNGVTVAACQDGFFVVAGDGSQKFYWNEFPNSGVSWNGLDFGSVEGSPDDTVGVLSDHRELWFPGTDSTEVFVNTGGDPLFARSGTGIIPFGAASPWTVQSFDNGVVWLSSSKDGQGMVLKSQGGNPTRMSKHAMETALSKYPTLADAFAFTFQIEGHSFYVLSFPTADATWLYDAASGEWFEWGWRDPADNTDHRHRANCYTFCAGVHLVGDWETGKVYSLETDVYTDNGDAIRRQRRTQSTNAGGKRLFFGSLTLDMETGVGNVDAPDPQIMLSYSDDDGRNFGTEMQESIGAEGDYGRVVRFSGLGATERGKGRVWELSMTDPVKFALFGADADVTQGT
jgi:hypothetical protein